MTTLDLIRQAGLSLPEGDLQEIVRRIVDTASPEKIILFGSAARGQLNRHSDLDLLVIKAGEYDQHQVTVEIYEALADSDYAKDIIVVTPQQVERYKDSFCLVLYPALREGKVIYDRAALRA